MAWNEETFRRRVYETAASQGRSVRSVLLEAQLPLDFFQKSPKYGHRVDSVDKIARVLGCAGIDEFMGIQTRVSIVVMKQAYAIVDEATRGLIDREQAMPHALMVATNVLLQAERDGIPLNDETLVSTLRRSIAEQLGSDALFTLTRRKARKPPE